MKKHEYELVSKNCPKCGGPINIDNPDITYSLSCPHCGSSIIWITGDSIKKARLKILDNALQSLINKNTLEGQYKFELEKKKEENKQILKMFILLSILSIVVFIIFFSLEYFI